MERVAAMGGVIVLLWSNGVPCVIVLVTCGECTGGAARGLLDDNVKAVVVVLGMRMGADRSDNGDRLVSVARLSRVSMVNWGSLVDGNFFMFT